MKRHFLFLFLFPLLGHAQAPGIEYQRTLDFGQVTRLNGAIGTRDGGFLLVGEVQPEGREDLEGLLVKLDYEGNTEWQKTFGGSANDDFRNIRVAEGKGYVIMGSTKSSGNGARDGWLVMVDEAGNTKWSKTFGQKDSEGFHDLVPTANGFILAGYSKSHRSAREEIGWLTAIDEWGNPQWEVAHTDKEQSRYMAVSPLENGNFAVTGFEQIGKEERRDLTLVVDATGAVQWEKSLYTDNRCEANGLVVLPGGDFIVVGTEKPLKEGNRQAFAYRISPTGTVKWQKNYGPAGTQKFYLPILNGAGEVIVAGETEFSSTGRDAWLVCLDPESGTLKWEHKVGANQKDHFASVVQSRDGGYLAIGRQNEVGLVVKYKGDGQPVASNPAASIDPIGDKYTHKGESSTATGGTGDIAFTPPSEGKNYLVILAIDEYQHWTPLSNAVKDAQDVKQVLTTQYNFTADATFELYNGDVSKTGIIGLLTEVAKTVTPNDNVLIYYSGHGHYDALIEEGYWVMAETPKGAGMVAEMLPNSTLTKYIKAIKSKHTFLVADACFSGALFASGHRGYVENVEALPSRWGLTSGTLEYVSDGQAGKNSPFCHYFLKYLKTAEKNAFPVSELIQYVKVAVANNAGQTPVGAPIKGVGDEGGEFVFRRR